MEVAQRGGVVVERSGHLRVGRPEQRGPDGTPALRLSGSASAYLRCHL